MRSSTDHDEEHRNGPTPAAATSDLGQWRQPDPSDHVTLMVHGIGDQRHAATLSEWGDALHDWLERIVCQHKGTLSIVDAVPAGRGSEPAWARGEIVIEGGVRSFTLVEGTWADLVEEPPFTRIVAWAIQALPATLIDQVRGMVRRRAEMARCRSPARVRRLHWVSWAGLVAFGGLMALLLIPVVLSVLVVTSVLGLVSFVWPGAGNAAAAVQKLMAVSVGDVLVFTGSKVRQAMIVNRIRSLVDACTEWVAEDKGERIVTVVAHSQGTEVTRRALEMRSQPDPDHMNGVGVRWFTFGQALDKARVVTLPSEGVLAASIWATLAVASIVLSGTIGQPRDVLVGLAFATAVIVGPVVSGWAVYGLGIGAASIWMRGGRKGDREVISAVVSIGVYAAVGGVVALTTPIAQDDPIIVGLMWPLLVAFQIPAFAEFGNSGTGWSLLAAFVGYIPMFFVSQNVWKWLSVEPETTKPPPGLVGWVDVASVADPVPNGQPALRHRDAAGERERVVTHNTGSMLRDHTAYWHNRNHFLPLVIRAIFGEDVAASWKIADEDLQKESSRRRRITTAFRLAWWGAIPVVTLLVARFVPADLHLDWSPPLVPDRFWDPVRTRPREFVGVLGLAVALSLVSVVRARSLGKIEDRYLSTLRADSSPGIDRECAPDAFGPSPNL